MPAVAGLQELGGTTAGVRGVGEEHLMPYEASRQLVASHRDFFANTLTSMAAVLAICLLQNSQ
jgi:hypothetical protein